MVLRRVVASGAALLLAAGVLSPAVAQALPDPDPSDITAVLDVSKSVAPATVGPGDSVTFTISIGCSAISDVGCRGAVTTDSVPEPFVIDSVTPAGPNAAATPEVDGQDVLVTWVEDIGGGATGMLDNTTSQITIAAHVPEDVSYDYDGQTITNTAVGEATNAADDPASAEVTINVPLDLETTAGKSFEPASALASSGTPVTAGLSGSNDSNATVESLVIQDPTDPDADPSPFTYLGFEGFGDVSAPEGTTGTTYEVYVDGAWVVCPDGELPAGVDPADVRGTRVTFTGAIPAGADASVDLDLETTDAAASVTDDTTVANDVESQVTRDGEEATDDATADFVIQANAIDVSAGKAFDPDIVVAGQSSDVRLDAANDSAIAIDSLTVTEPSSGSFPDDYAFGGFTGPVTFPTGATSATVTYQPSGEQFTFTADETPPPPAAGAASVTSFSIEFQGQIAAGATAVIPFEVTTDADASGLPNTVTNEVAVEGENDGAIDDDTAEDDLYIYGEVLEPYIGKNIYPSQILANPGEVVTVALEGGTTELPNPPETTTGSTGDAEQVVIQDPLDPIEGNAWWNAFDLEAITQTPIPADAELTVYYYDTSTSSWEVLDGPIAGPDVYSSDVPDDISDVAGGVRFVYDYTGDADGFPPGTDFAPRFTSSLRDIGRYDQESPPYNTDPDQPNTLVPNCAQSSASNETNGTSGDAAMDPGEPGGCPDVEIIPTDGQGVGDLVDKEFGTSSSGGDKSVIARSGDTIPSTLSWSTGGYSGLETVDITDIADPEGTEVEDSLYDAFDLARVAAISATDDPLLQYDRIASVQLWDGDSWDDAENDPCPQACDGTFPGMDLTADEQASTLGVRLVFEESPNRATTAGDDPAAPPVGSGVARSFGNDRNLSLVWRVRDEKRSDGSPVLEENTYNLDEPGVVRNQVNATGHPFDGDDISTNDVDDVTILDVPITTTTTKDWLGGPLALPAAGTPAESYPRSRIRVTTTNTTPARVDQLRIVDPAPGSTTEQDPFDYVDVVRIAGITVPTGATTTQVVLTCADGTTRPSAPPGFYTRAEALALTAMPCPVTGIEVLFDGRIASAASGVLALDVRLRATHRGTGAPITPADSPVLNTAQGVVADVDAIQDCPPPADARYACAQDPATIEIVNPTFGIVAGKSIEAASQVEGDDSPVTVTVSARNTGTAVPYMDEITDDDATFWNAFDLQRMDPSWTLPQPVEHVQACYLSGGDFTATNVTGDVVGGTWTCQALPPGPPFADGDLTLEAARSFIDTAAATVPIHGLRFRFMAGSDAGWQSPSNPLIEVPFEVVRRDDLRSGGPVPTTRSDQTAAPGEADAGVFVDTVDVAGQSVLIGADTRLSDTDTAQDDYTYEHLTVGVEVEKTPTGEVPPGTVIPFTLEFTNTGESPLTDPVFTDELPSDADGPMLIFDPESDPSVSSPYSFELEGDAPDPPNGDPLPTDQDDITIATNDDGDEITFAMPEGTVLEPGQTYTITIELMLRPGLTPDDELTNTATIDADEPFDPAACATTYDTATGRCEDDTVISPVRVAALRTVKSVKADVPVDESGIPEVWLDRDVVPEGVELPDDYCDTAADADGFYRAPCVPVTYPGDTETWRYTITNVGTLPLDELVSVDVLPHVGDTGTIVPAPRGSEWTPTFAGGLRLFDAPGGADVQIFYTDTYDACTDDLTPLTDSCEPGDWLPYDPVTVPNEDVRALKTVATFPDGSLFQPGESLTIDAQSRTTPESASDSAFPVAWNTVATGGVSNDGGTRATVTPTEGRKVGVTYPTGPLQLRKVVTGDGARFAPDSFTVQPVCTIEGEPIEGLEEVTLESNGDPVEIDGLPWGAECTATESAQGQTSSDADSATVGGPDDDIGLVTVTNEFDVAGMQVTKQVSSEAVDQDGTAIDYGPFVVLVECTFLGGDVYGDGYGPLNPMRHEIVDGETWAISGLPIGATCTTTEPDDADAAGVTISDETVTIGGEDGSAGDVQAVTVTNTFATGSLYLRKYVLPQAVEEFPVGEGPFTLHVRCTLTDASHPDGAVVYEDDIVLEGPQPLEATIDDIATGAVCVTTEPDPGDATTSIVTPQQVTIGDDTTVAVRAVNLFGGAAATITKTREGAGADLYGAGPFEVTLQCTYTGVDGEQEPLNTPGGAMRTLSADNDYTATFEPLLFGSTCRIEETGSGGANAVSITDVEGNEVSEFTVDSLTESLQFEVTNTFDVGSLEVVKTVRGEGPDRFDVALSCFRDVDGVATDVDVPGGATRTLSSDGDFTATYEDLPAGAECELRESDDGGADVVEISPNDGDPEVGTAVVGEGTTVSLSVVNTFEADAADAADAGGGPGGDLSDAGGPAWTLPMLATGLAALGAGLMIIRTARRRRE
ncbi:DUF5979 domain-containing protein [Aeromicrobium choanae]|uniref:Conserved repeat domain-containing protein n=1 Tax=Aeromicrobium choanae TaxID=1736691 RepID=A0A1T4Z162_9ACTN|nr:DUF5979 domain-containing protein [Aeromicrobium choanae]SKB07285.1 conserved repeat domain-containing protein [Aeromicrobium choanae]